MQYLAIERQKICIRSPHATLAERARRIRLRLLHAALTEQKQRVGCVHYIWHRQGSVAHSAASVACGAGRVGAAHPAASIAYDIDRVGAAHPAAFIAYGTDRGVWRIRLRLLHAALTERVRRAGCICCIWHRQSGRGELAASVAYGSDRAGAAHPAACHAMKRGRFAIGAPFFMAS